MTYDQLVILLRTAPYTKGCISSHHSGKGTHIQIEYPNGHNVSITSNTGDTDANDTFEILTSAEINPRDENEPGQLYRQSYMDIASHLLTISKMT